MSWPRQVWHVFNKDVRRFWWMLAGVGGYVGVWLLSSTAGDAAEGASDALVELAPYLFALVTAAIVLEDSPGRASTPLHSRPLAPSAVLAAKTVLLGAVLVCVPIAASWWWLGGFAPSGRGSAVFGMFVGHGGWVLSAALIAAASASLRQFVVFGLVGLVMLRYAPIPFELPLVESVNPDRFKRFAVWALGLPLILDQFRSRRSMRTLSILAVGLLFSITGVTFAADSAAHGVVRPGLPNAPPNHVEVRALGLHIGNPLGDMTEASVRADLRLTTSAGLFPVIRAGTTRLLKDGHVVSRGMRIERRRGFALVRAYETHPDLRIVNRDEVAPEFGEPVEVWWSPPAELSRELRDAHGFQLDLMLDLYRAERVAKLPLRQGGSLQLDSVTLEVTDIQRRQGRLQSITVTSWRPTSGFQRSANLQTDLAFALINEERGEAFMPQGVGGSSARREGLAGGLVHGTRWDLNVSDREGRWDGPDENWLADATIGVVVPVFEAATVARVTQEVGEWPSGGARISLEPEGKR